MRRVHRTLLERFQYLAIYACKSCNTEESVPYGYRMHFGAHARCPVCGTRRLSKLREPDKIDPMHTSLMNWLERMVGGRLYHCRFCRIQFYDRRKLPSETAAGAPPAESPEAAAQGKASGGDAL